MNETILWQGIAHDLTSHVVALIAMLKSSNPEKYTDTTYGIMKANATVERFERAKAYALPEQQKSMAEETPAIVKVLLAFDRTRGMDCNRFIREVYGTGDDFGQSHLTDKLIGYCAGNTVTPYGIIDFYSNLDGNNRAAFDRWIYTQ